MSSASEKHQESGPELGRDGEKIVVRAYDYASAYNLRLSRQIFEKDLGGKVLNPDPLLVQLEAGASVALFDYGSAVSFNMQDGEGRQLLQRLDESAQRPNKVLSTDEFTLYFAPKQKKPEGTDELYIKEFNRDTALLVAAVLSRSVALEYYETMVDNALDQLEQTIDALAHQGRMPRGQTALTRQVGFAMLVEHELAHSIAALDDPDIVWDGGARINRLYLALKREFDLEERTRVIQQKVSLISRWSTFVISRLEAHRSRVLEWIIIILILSEVVLVLLGKA